MSLDVGSVAQPILATLAQMGVKVLWALVLWLVGRRLIGFAINMLRAALHRQSVDPTLVRYLYWQVSFDTNRTIRGAFGEAGFPVPEPHYVVTSAPGVARGYAPVHRPVPGSGRLTRDRCPVSYGGGALVAFP